MYHVRGASGRGSSETHSCPTSIVYIREVTRADISLKKVIDLLWDVISSLMWFNILAAIQRLYGYDYSCAQVALVPSVPGGYLRRRVVRF